MCVPEIALLSNSGMEGTRFAALDFDATNIAWRRPNLRSNDSCSDERDHVFSTSNVFVGAMLR